MYKNSSALSNNTTLSNNTALWHCLGKKHLDLGMKNNSTLGVLIREIQYSYINSQHCYDLVRNKQQGSASPVKHRRIYHVRGFHC